MYEILTKEMLTPAICRMSVKAPRLAAAAQPGQFLIVLTDSKGERIPLTISDYDPEKGTVTIVTQKIGVSSCNIVAMECGDSFAGVVGPLGKASDFMEMPLKNYSSGMVARIAFSIATITEPDILIVDEALSVGDFLFQQKCARRIRQLVESNHVTVLLVSHDINLVERMCDRVCWIEKGHQRMLGPTAEVCAAYKGLGE